jgi:hypothetical protein
MNLTELEPEFMPEGATTVDQADTLWFNCPGCVGTERAHRLRMPFAQKHPTGTAWTVQGSDFTNLSFVDDPRGSRSLRVMGYPCHSHFNITSGQIEFHGDSKSP